MLGPARVDVVRCVRVLGVRGSSFARPCSLAGILSIGIDFGVVSNPEFLREGTAVDDFRHPPKTVIGAFDECTGAQVAQLYEHFDAPLICTSVEIAELINTSTMHGTHSRSRSEMK